MKKYKDQKQYRYCGYNYAQAGFYFVTICTKDRERYFGDISNRENAGTQSAGTQNVGTQSAGTQNVGTQSVGTQNFAFLRKTEIGKIAEKCWREIPRHFPFVKLDEFVIMPDHLHGIIEITENNFVGTQSVGTQNFAFLRYDEYRNKFGPQSKNLSSIIRGYKIGVTNYAKQHNIQFAWQPRFHDRIIRNGIELNRVRQYIMDNPEKWESDKNNQENILR